MRGVATQTFSDSTHTMDFTGKYAPEGFINITAPLHKYEYSKDRNKQTVGVEQGQIVAILSQETNDTLFPYPQCIVHADCLREVNANIDVWKPRIIGYGIVAEGNIVPKGGKFAVQTTGMCNTTKTRNRMPGFVHVRVVIAVSPKDNKWYFDLEEMARPGEAFHFIRDISADDETAIINFMRGYIASYDANQANPTPATQQDRDASRLGFSELLGIYFQRLEDLTLAKTITGGEEDTTKRLLLRC